MLCCVRATLQETLTYAALLRLPGAMTRKQKVERVDTVLEALGLTKSKDTIIGKHLCWYATCCRSSLACSMQSIAGLLHVRGLHSM